MLKYSYYDEEGKFIAIVNRFTSLKEIEKLKEKYDEVRYDE